MMPVLKRLPLRWVRPLGYINRFSLLCCAEMLSVECKCSLQGWWPAVLRNGLFALRGHKSNFEITMSSSNSESSLCVYFRNLLLPIAN